MQPLLEKFKRVCGTLHRRKRSFLDPRVEKKSHLSKLQKLWGQPQTIMFRIQSLRVLLWLGLGILSWEIVIIAPKGATACICGETGEVGCGFGLWRLHDGDIVNTNIWAISDIENSVGSKDINFRTIQVGADKIRDCDHSSNM